MKPKPTLLAVLFTLTLIMTSAAALLHPAGQTTASAAPALSFTHLSTSAGDLEAPTSYSGVQQSTATVFDVDKDGVQDFILGLRKVGGPSVVWYRRGASGWTRYIIETQPFSMEPGSAFEDIDQDGDLDLVLTNGDRGNQIWWWENPYPNYDPNTTWKRYLIKDSGAIKHHDYLFGDFTGDGKPDFVFWNQYAYTLNLAEIPANPKTSGVWAYTPIFTLAGDKKIEGLDKADVNLDGKLDLVGGGRWFRNEGGKQFTAFVIDDDFRYGRAVVGQLIPGGYPEVVFTMGDAAGRIKWYQWNGASTWSGHDLGPVDHGHSLQLADFNRDGALDIFVAEMRLDGANPDSGTWIFLGNGQGQFSRFDVASGFDNHESRAADLDGDGDMDILGKPFNYQTPALNIWLNNSPPPNKLPLNQWQRHVIDDARPWRAIFIGAADINGDGRKDIVNGGWWYQNPGNADSAWQRHTIGSPLNNMAAIYDFDQDGDPDILGTGGQGSGANSHFAWAENQGGGKLVIHQNIQDGAGNFLQGVAVARFEGSALGVALSWHDSASATEDIQMLTIPADPTQGTWSIQSIPNVSQQEALSAGDIDRDGLIDLLLGTRWLSNLTSGWTSRMLSSTPGELDRNRLADMNGDGRLDAVLGFETNSTPGKLAWYEQVDPVTGNWVEHLIGDQNMIAPMSLDVADLDGDGDLDVSAGEHNLLHPELAALYIFENTNGKGTAWQRHTVAVGDEHHMGARLVDLDGDGDLDILSMGWGHSKVLWYENLAKTGTPVTPTPPTATPPIPTPTTTPPTPTVPPSIVEEWNHYFPLISADR